MPAIACIGYGYVAKALTARLKGWDVIGTSRAPSNGLFTIEDAPLENVTHLLISAPPDDKGDPVIGQIDFKKMPQLSWVGYLSTTGVYGDQGGAWVDEETPPRAAQARSIDRLKAEEQWQAAGLPLHIFRLAGIYGPGRSAIDTARAGKLRRIDKPGHVFNRIHVDDIAATLHASIDRPQPGAIYNLADDFPAPSHEVNAYAAELLGMTPPPLEPFDTAEMSPMLREFYAENKRVRNDKIKKDLGVTLQYPDYKSGLKACL